MGKENIHPHCEKHKEIKMDSIQLLVNILGLAVIAWIVWYFWLYKKEGVQVAEIGGSRKCRSPSRAAMTRT